MSSISKDKIFRLISEELQVPTVFKHMIHNWKCKDWKLSEWANSLPEKLQFRVGFSSHTGSPLWESDSKYVEASMCEFIQWTENTASLQNNPFGAFSPDTSWAYAGYKYMAELYKDNPNYLKVVDWSNFGFSGRDGSDSTLWIGSKGANTPCHYDTYGYNLVAQLHGKKRWIMFPPSQSSYMQPTRIPYEESSVYSSLNIADPQLDQFPDFSNTTPYIGYLEAGDVLFVPKHWWHYVECLETSVSVNTWIEIKDDNHGRLEEAITKAIMSSFVIATGAEDWLNPNEELDDADYNMTCLHQALKCSLEYASQYSDDLKNVSGSLNKEDVGVNQRLARKRTRILTSQEKCIKIDPSIAPFVLPLEPTSFSCYLHIIRKDVQPVEVDLKLISPSHNLETKKLDLLNSGIEDSNNSTQNDEMNEAECEGNVNLQKLLVNSICHPDIISQIAKQMKKDWALLNKKCSSAK